MSKTLANVLRDHRAYVQHWMDDVHGNLKPTQESLANALARLNIAIAALESAPVAVPAGWRAVPEEPTEEMIEAGDDLIPVTRGTESYLIGRGRNGAPENIFRAMLSAAPPPPASDVAEMVEQHEVNFADLELLKRAIEECDPRKELWLRVDDLIRRTRAALSKYREKNNG